MGKVLWLLVGVVIGFVLAHQVSRTEQGKRVFATVNGVVDEFAQTVADSYRARLAETDTAA
jgi:uncharacterized membrane protein YeaQ/YmgE (transglycosylase-associated protein family)